jgi:adenylate cyclase
MQQAQQLLIRAIKADPKYAYAMALLSTCCRHSVFQHFGTGIDLKEGVRLAREAISIGNDDPLVLAEAANNLASLARDYDGAANAMERSIMLHPSSASTHGKAGWLRNYMEEPAKAKTHFERAMRLSPVDLEMYNFLSGYSVAQLQMEEWSEGATTAQRALDLQPNWATAHRCRVVAFVNLGMTKEAEEAGRLLLHVAPHFRVGAYSKTSPFRTNRFWSVVVDGLRKAGLPE